MRADKIWEILNRYLNEETDGEFIRYYTLNPACVKPLMQDFDDLLIEETVRILGDRKE